jgi:hypothetical protein
MQVQVYQHSTLGSLVLQLAISSPASDQFITDEALQALRSEVEEVASTLYANIEFS